MYFFLYPLVGNENLKEKKLEMVNFFFLIGYMPIFLQSLIITSTCPYAPSFYIIIIKISINVIYYDCFYFLFDFFWLIFYYKFAQVFNI